MHVLHTVNSLLSETGGPARSVPGLAGAVAATGIDVSLWSPAIPDDFEAPNGVNILTGTPLPDPAAFSAVHDHGVWLPFNHRVARWSRQNKLPRIVSPRGMLEPWALNHQKLKKKAAWLLYQRTDLRTARALHATAPSEAAQFKELGLDQEIILAPNGVDLPNHPRPAKSTKTVVFLSRVHPKKGLPLWVEAWKRAAPPDWTMRVIGPDELDHTAEVKNLADKAGVSAQWQFDGSLEGTEKLDALAGADLFVLPTYSENFGIVVAEALALGTPVITTTGTPWQGLEEHTCGWWVEPTAEALTTAFQDALSKLDQLPAMGQRGQKWVRQEFTWPQIGQTVAKAYHNLLNGH